MCVGNMCIKYLAAFECVWRGESSVRGGKGLLSPGRAGASARLQPAAQCAAPPPPSGYPTLSRGFPSLFPLKTLGMLVNDLVDMSVDVFMRELLCVVEAQSEKGGAEIARRDP